MDRFTSDHEKSPSGVRIASDFRDNLIIDRYHPVFLRMRSSKIKHMRSENSEDALTWNVFRCLRQINPEKWFPQFFQSAFPNKEIPPFNKSCVIKLWQNVNPPLKLLEYGDEGESEIDICIESADWVWFIEAKLNSDISQKTTTRLNRNQVLRNIDVGSYYSGVRDFYFSLLIKSETSSKLGVQKIKEYKDLNVPKEKLKKHRPNQLKNLQGVSYFKWSDFKGVLEPNSKTEDDESYFADLALKYLQRKNI